VRRPALAVVTAACALLLVACGDEAEPVEEPTPRAISQECLDAFNEAHAEMEDREDERIPEGGQYEGGPTVGTLNELKPTVPACSSTEEWFEAYRATWSERTEGISPSQALRTLCRSTRDETIRDAEVCQEIVVEVPEGQPGDD
jgi:hypothetical protein